MIKFAEITEAPKPQTKESQQIATIYAGVAAFVTLAVLFFFEDAVVFVSSLPLLGFIPGLIFISLLSVSGVFSLPFLLRMPLSVAFRHFSAALSWVFAVMVSLVFIVTYFSADVLQAPELFNIYLLTGSWMLFVPFMLIIMAIWSSWGLLPSRRP